MNFISNPLVSKLGFITELPEESFNNMSSILLRKLEKWLL